ncbi:phytoene desaturase family protein [Aequorivita vladivostokensis]|jgi:phytoene desaturase|uniref:Phytoene dehydrogenase n=1 Tax=Aequorivita vladivostokensis TaxID=171194 RepID=A0ABR5DFK1_9FLAO|nr:phytoene desaturase family protein [Aequorivita vladivostokensis]KJJ37549.1 phytoene dehydrogenase [Aequorivita vladivostokensis]HAV55876.1 phytoene desaturase [Aequorivita sp.]|tara:strand:- start:859 stop:2322 length:1464 start_codon:yes stop_codon:yes gene_type:complete
MKDIAVIGSGFSSLAASCYLAQAGNKVTIYEKNGTIGGRARQLKKDGFTFDMGPTWYWMPDVFERFFKDFGKRPSDFYALEKLNPAYRVYFANNEYITIEDTLEKICTAFENEEAGSSIKLKKFMAQALDNYNIAIKDLVYRPGVSPMELVTAATMKKIGQFFSTISKDVRREFSNPKLISILEFPVLFLGAKPSDTPSFYSFMNYADFGLGTFHPKNGMYSVIDGIKRLAEELGVTIKTNENVEKIIVENGKTSGLISNGEMIEADVVLSGADYHHTETLLEKRFRKYSENYWSKKTFAPSALLFYVGFDTKIKHVDHHTLFFDVDFKKHSEEIYDSPKWPDEPLFYASFPSKTDNSVAPEGKEGGIFLIPLAPGLDDIPEIREEYFEKIMARFEQITAQEVKKYVIFKESFCINDFISDYNSYKGNAYGLANTLMQTAFLRPKLKSKKVKNLFFTGQLTVPGPGVPPALISGKLVAGLIDKENIQ